MQSDEKSQPEFTLQCLTSELRALQVIYEAHEKDIEGQRKDVFKRTVGQFTGYFDDLVERLELGISILKEYGFPVAATQKLRVALMSDFKSPVDLAFDSYVELNSLLEKVQSTECHTAVVLSRENERLLSAMLEFQHAGTFQDLIERAGSAFRGEPGLPSVATRLKNLKAKLPRAHYDYIVHENDYSFKWVKRPRP